MFPANAVVLFVEADDIRSLLDLVVASDEHTIEVLDHAETVTAEGQIVRTVACSTISKVKGLFAVEWVPRVGVGHGHLADGKSVEHAPSIVSNVVDDGTLARVKCDPESPSLPLNQRVVCDRERRSFWL